MGLPTEEGTGVKSNRWLGLILLIYLLLGAAYAWVVPLGEAPDEIDHFLYVRYLLEQHAFPVMHPTAAENDTMEANQPPLFYLLNAAVTAPFPMTATADFPLNACYTFDPHDGGRANFYLHDPAEQNPLASDYLAFRAARLVSVLLGAVTVWLAYQLGRQMTPGDTSTGLLAAALLAFNPQFLFITASVNNDVLTAVLGAALVYVSVQAATAPRWRQFSILGGLMGLALLTKFALLALWPLPFLAALLTAGREQRKLAVQGGALVAGLPVLIAGWWYVRAARLYGDPLAWRVHLQAKGVEVLRTTPLTLTDLREFVVIHFQSYWAWFGWLKIQAPSWVYGVLVGITAVAIIGLVLIGRDWAAEVKRKGLSGLKSQYLHLSNARTATLFNLLAVAAIYASLLRYIRTINWSGYQGRLAYAAAAAAAALLALGWQRVAKTSKRLVRHGDLVRALPGLALAALAVGSLLFLIYPAYPRPDLYQPAAAIPRSCTRIAGLEVEAVPVANARSGDVVQVQPWLYGLETAVSQPLQIQIVGRDEQIIAETEAVFNWTKGQLWQPSFALPLATTQPVRASVRLGYPGALHDIGMAIIRPERPLQPQPQHLLQANFGDQLRLIGYDWQGQDDDSQTSRITLYWQAITPMDADYTTFVHVLDSEGVLVAQADGQPQAGAYPTSVWEAGEIVVDEKAVILTGERPLHVVAGVYLLETGIRLPRIDTTTDVTELFVLDKTP